MAGTKSVPAVQFSWIASADRGPRRLPLELR